MQQQGGRRSPVVLAMWVCVIGGMGACQSNLGGAGLAGGPPGASGGVTPGGAKDIGFARAQIKNGVVPRPETITVEGLMSEHDIPVEGDRCTAAVCARPALGVAPFLETKKREHFVQLGFGTAIDPATFRRPPVDLVVLIDRSASMAGDQAETNLAVTTLIRKLRDDDRLGILIFNERVETLAPFGPLTNRATLTAKVMAIQPIGGSDILAAMRAAFQVADGVAASPQRLRRVMVLSCGYPDVGPTPADPVRRLVLDAGNRRIGLSFYGVLLGWNRALADLLGQARGGSYHYLESLAKVVQVFDTDLDLMLTPVLYGLKIAVEPDDRFDVVKLYGMPGTPDDTAGMTPPPPPGSNPPSPARGETGGAFLSNRRGAIVAHLRLKEGARRGGTVGAVSLQYEPEPALGLGAAPVDETVPIADADVAAETEAGAFQGIGVRKAVALLNQATRMKAACAAVHAGRAADAVPIVRELLDYLKSEASLPDNASLMPEVALIEKLLANVMKGLPPGAL